MICRVFLVGLGHQRPVPECRFAEDVVSPVPDGLELLHLLEIPLGLQPLFNFPVENLHHCHETLLVNGQIPVLVESIQRRVFHSEIVVCHLRHFHGICAFAVQVYGVLPAGKFAEQFTQFQRNAFIFGSFCPGFETLLISFLLLLGAVLHQTGGFSLPLLPGIGHIGVLCRIAYTYVLGLSHMLLLDVQPERPERNLLRVGNPCDLPDLSRMDVLPGLARETVDESEIPLVHAFVIDPEEPFRAVWTVALAVRGRIVLRVGIYTEHREIAGVTRPHPVVRIPAELSYGRRRRPDETDVVILAIDEQIIAVSVKHGFDACHQAVAVRCGFSHKLRAVLRDKLLPVLFFHTLAVTLQDYGSHVLHPLEYPHPESRTRQFRLPVHRPETVTQIIVFHARMLLNMAVAAVVVCQQQSLRGNDFAGAAPSEEHD